MGCYPHEDNFCVYVLPTEGYTVSTLIKLPEYYFSNKIKPTTFPHVL